ncbi:MAG: hypothetical protein RJA81_2158 [Planctomycetota bacterium]|jgi:hypothetical protein
MTIKIFYLRNIQKKKPPAPCEAGRFRRVCLFFKKKEIFRRLDQPLQPLDDNLEQVDRRLLE